MSMETQKVWLAWKPPRATTCRRRGQVRGRRREQAPSKCEETPELRCGCWKDPRESSYSSFIDGEPPAQASQGWNLRSPGERVSSFRGREGASPGAPLCRVGVSKGGTGADKQPLHRFRSTSISDDLFHLGISGQVQGFTAIAPGCEKPKR